MTEILRSDPQDECGLKLQNLLLTQNDIQLQNDHQEQVFVNAYLANVELKDKATLLKGDDFEGDDEAE